MREHLLGYVLGALDDEEAEQVERHLETDSEGREKLSRLRLGLGVLHDEHLPPCPKGLAHRAVRAVRANFSAAVASEMSPTSGRWGMRFHDYLVAASILVIAGALVLPAIGKARWESQQIACRGHLHELGDALAAYSERFEGALPPVPPRGHFAIAGIFGPMLTESGYITDESVLFCPGRGRDGRRVPTIDELRQARRKTPGYQQLAMLAGGDYAYRFGYTEHDAYYGPRNHGRAHFPVLSDRPPAPPTASNPNHGGSAQNVLFEDGHVAGLRTPNSGSADHIYLNHAGVVRAGLGPDDAVLAPSPARPLEF